jgi:glycine cleavage system H lipoate-binding protein
MTVVLVLLTFILFLLIDYFKSRGKVAVITAEARTARPARRLVGGFSVPENLLYHPGHTWALDESPALVRVGMDDFAAKLIGRADGIVLPQRGTWVRQGQKFAAVVRDGREVSLVSPVEGTVADVNSEAVRDPEAARKDAYGAGWLMTVNSPDKRTSFRQLLRGTMARWWVEDAMSRLHPAMAQDGGEACDDFLTEMGRDWEATAKEFLLN